MWRDPPSSLLDKKDPRLRGMIMKVVPMETNEDVVEAIDGLAYAVHLGLSNLGNGNAATPMGALEAHGQAILAAGENIASAIRELSISIDRFKG